MTESVEWARLADHDRPEPAATLPCEATWWPVMADKRLNDIGKALVVAGGPTIAHELYDEVQRLRTLEESYRGDVRRLRERAETAERELAEMRERIAGAIVGMPESEAPDNYAVPAWYDGYERAVEDAARTAREWKPAEQQPEDGDRG